MCESGFKKTTSTRINDGSGAHTLCLIFPFFPSPSLLVLFHTPTTFFLSPDPPFRSILENNCFCTCLNNSAYSLVERAPRLTLLRLPHKTFTQTCQVDSVSPINSPNSGWGFRHRPVILQVSLPLDRHGRY